MVAGAVPVTWLGLVAAPGWEEGLLGILGAWEEAAWQPFSLTVNRDSLRCALLFLLVYAVACAAWLSSRGHYRRREEYGSARWGAARSINRKYADKKFTQNHLLTASVRMGLDGRRHRRNLNTVICGGSGAGKTRGYCLPNALCANSSMVVIDPKGEIVRFVGSFLEKEGYEIKVLDLIDMERSHCYNPFFYIRTDNDVQRLVSNLFKSTTPKQSGGSQDPFWDTSAQMLLSALIYYLVYEAPEEEKNFAMVLEMLRYGEVREEDEEYQSPLDELFERLEMRQPEHIAVKYYKNYRSGSGKTLKSIQITLAARLEKFNIPSVAALTMTDELDLPSLGERKTALFCILPDNDNSFNFIIGLLYLNLFQQLFYLADRKYGGALPVPVHVLMDEFANVQLPDDFETLCSVMRSRNVYVSIVLQGIGQLKKLFEKSWQTILANCDSFLYLGGNDEESLKVVNGMLGKETIDTNTYGKTSGRSGSYSTNYQSTGRELLTVEEIRKLDNDYALLFIRGEDPVKDRKLDVKRHPNYRFTPEGGGIPYEYGKAEQARATLRLVGYAQRKEEETQNQTEEEERNVESDGYILFSEEELEGLWEKGGAAAG